MFRSAINKKIESFASDVYIKDSTGENYIENIINTNNLSALMSRLEMINGDKFEATGFEVSERFGYFVKIVPNSMMVGWSHDLIKALTNISSQLPPYIRANVGLIATNRAG